MYAYELAKPLKAQGLIQVDGEDDEYIRVKERGICEGGGGYVHSREAASEGFVRWRKLASADDLLGSCCCLGSFLISNVLGSSPHFF
jgi:hypothetical protein